MDVDNLEVGKSYFIAWKARDLGNGGGDDDTGSGTFTYWGEADDWGKHEFAPDAGGTTIYLFTDEITSVRTGAAPAVTTQAVTEVLTAAGFITADTDGSAYSNPVSEGFTTVLLPLTIFNFGS